MDENKKKKIMIAVSILVIILIVLLSIFMVIKSNKGKNTSSGNLEENLLEERLILGKRNIKLDLSGSYTDKIEATIENKREGNAEIAFTSSDESVVEVNSEGEIVGLKEGNAVITAKYKEFEEICQVVVISSTISEVLSEDVTEKEIDLSYTNTIKLILNEDAIDLDAETIIWISSDENIAKVDSKGTVTALNNGEVVIKGVCGDKTIIYNLKVTTSVVNVELNKTSINLKLPNNTKDMLRATVYPETAENKEINWTSSNENVAVVGQDGKITAVNTGKAVITANCNGIIAECTVVVSKASTNNSNSNSNNGSNNNSNNNSNSNNIVKIQKLTMNSSNVQLDISKNPKYELKAIIYPYNTTDKQIAWSSSNNNVATVSNGTVTAKNNGEATITAKCGDKTATCKIAVITSPTSITLDKTQVTINKGTTAKLTATVNPSGATNKNVEWHTSNSNIATVSEGIVTAKNNGDATITAKCGDKTATCKVKVITPNIPVSKITLNKSAIALNVGSEFRLEGTVTPTNATNKTVTWSTNNANVAVLYGSSVKAIGVGDATITATCGGKTATCYVRVIPKKGISTGNYGGSRLGSYYLYVPDASKIVNPRELPLVVFLHGGGELGSAGFQLLPKHNTFVKVIYEDTNYNSFNGIMIAPHLRSGNSWIDGTAQSELNILINQVKSNYKISGNKVSITGASLGASGSWAMAARYPSMFSCVVPVANCNSSFASLPKEISVWCIVGSRDPSGLNPTKSMYNKATGKKDLTVLEGITHDNVGYQAYKWSQFSNLVGYRVNVINWMMEQSR